MSEYSSSEYYAGADIRDIKAAFDDVALTLLHDRRRYKLSHERWYESSTDGLIDTNGDRMSVRARVQVEPDLLTARNIVLFEQNERPASNMDQGSRRILNESLAEHVADSYDWIRLSRLISVGSADVQVQTLVQTSYEFIEGELPSKRLTGSVGILDASGARFILDDIDQYDRYGDDLFEQIKRRASMLTPEDLSTIRHVLRLFE